MKYISWLILDIMLFVAMLFTSVQLVVSSESYFQWHYEAHNIEETTGMDTPTLMSVTKLMMEYLFDYRDTLNMRADINGEMEEVFGEREKLHMDDVKHLFLAARQMRNISVGVLLTFILGTFFYMKGLLYGWFKQLKVFFIGLFIVATGFGALLSQNFNAYFVKFHLIFFQNDLWMLNPKTDVLINMVPEIFFFQTSFLILGVFLLLLIAILLIRSLIPESWRQTR